MNDDTSNPSIDLAEIYDLWRPVVPYIAFVGTLGFFSLVAIFG